MHSPTLPGTSPRRPRRRLAWLLLPTLLAPAAATAQLVPGLPISVELRTAAALPLGELGRESPGLGAGTGLGAGAALHVQLTSSLAAYGGYDYGRFTCGACSAGLGDGVPEAGFEAGVEWLRPFGMGSAMPWLGAGVLIGRRLEVPDGADGFASESSTGWSVGAGVRVPVGRSLRLATALRYRDYSAGFVFPDLGFGFVEAGALEQELHVASLSLEVGLAYEL